MISFNGRGCGEIMRKFGQIEQQLQVFQRLAFALGHNARHGNPSLKKKVKKNRVKHYDVIFQVNNSKVVTW